MADEQSGQRARLSRQRVLEEAVALADREGLEAVTMRNLADHLGVVPMALYKHVANKEELLDGMVDVIVAEIEPVPDGLAWQAAVRARVLGARRAMLGHRWAREVVESRPRPTIVVLEHLDSVIGLLRGGGLSVDLVHHVMHALGSRVWGFSPALFGDGAPPAELEADPAAFDAIAERVPHVAEVVAEIARGPAHDATTVVGGGCDDQFEFEFALDLLLDGAARLHEAGWASGPARAAR